MAIVVDPGLLEYMASHSGACHFVVKDAPADDAVRGLQSARRAVGNIPHPEEPHDPLPSSMSAVERTGDGARFRVDIADAEAYDGLLERVLAAVLEGLAAGGVDTGLVTFPGDEPLGPFPEAPAPSAAAAGDIPLPPPGTTWSATGLPIPDPNQELWASRSGTERSAGYMLPHDTEFLLEYFELLPGVLLSYTATPPGDRPFAGVRLVIGGRSFSVRIRDAGTARNVEMTVETDNRKVEALVLELRSMPTPPGVQVRIDRR